MAAWTDLMRRVRKRLLVAVAVASILGVVAYRALPHLLYTRPHEPPLNTVVIDERLATSGQPSAAQLRRLRAAGYDAVVNLAPPGSYGSIADEAAIVREQGMAYYNISVEWRRPSDADFAQFRELLDTLRGRRVWVHCQMNMRASVFVFLHRVIDEHIKPDEAIAQVHAVWVPNAVWSGFVRDALGRAGVSYDPDYFR